MAKKERSEKAKSGYSLTELRKMASERKISGRSKMSKEQLVAALGLSAAAAAPTEKPRSSRVVSMPSKAASNSVIDDTVRKMSAPAPTSSAPQTPQAPSGVFIDWGPDVPPSYGQDTVSLMIKDPEWIFASWELTGEDSKRVKSAVGGDAHSILRLVREDGAVADVETGLSENWYFRVDPGVAYRAIAGFRDKSGAFHPVAASRLVKTPRVSVSGVVDTKWMIVRRRLEELLRYMGGFPAAGSLFAVEAQQWRMVKLAWSATPVNSGK